MQANNNKDFANFNLKTSLLLDVIVLSFLLIMFSIFGLGIPFGVVLAATIGTLKERLEGSKERTFNMFMSYSVKFLGKASLVWIIIYPLVILIGLNLYIATQMGELGLYIIIFDVILLILLFTYCFYVFYELVNNNKEKKRMIYKKAFQKMKVNGANTFYHIGIIFGIAGTLIFIPYYVLKMGIVYILIALLLIISCVSMKDIKES